MKKILTWYFIFTKRQLKRISTIFILVSMLLLTIGLKVMSTEITASIDVGFYMDNEDSIMTDIKNSLESHEGLLKFINYSSKEQLELAVSSGTLQCGYIFDVGRRWQVLNKFRPFTALILRGNWLIS